MAATDAMPLILDENVMNDITNDMAANMPVDLNVDVDDLFGEAVGVDLGLSQAPPPSKQLLQRIDELRSRGCCSRIAWSKQGTIASISADRRSVELRYLRAHPKDGTWGLSEPTSWNQFGGSPGTTAPEPIVHLAFNGTGHPDLAVVDAVGRITIITFSMTLNRPYFSRPWDIDSVDDLRAVVGCYWLSLVPPQKQYAMVHGPASRDAGGYRYESTYAQAFGPYHPNPTKSALLCVTTDGTLKLLYTQNNNKFQETQVELESITSSDDLVTHASICSEKQPEAPGGVLLVAMATSSKQLRVVRASIRWGIQQNEKQGNPGTLPFHPSLSEKHVAVTSWFQHDGSSESLLDTSMSQLSHIEILPSAQEQPTTTAPWHNPVVITVRIHTPVPESGYSQEVQSIMDRWEVVTEEKPEGGENKFLHPAFEQLGSRSQLNNAPMSVTRLRKLPPVIIHNKAIISITTTLLGKVICIAFSDGTVQYRDRFTFEEIFHEINVNRIMSLHQVGFSFSESSSCVEMMMSPTFCSFIQTCDDGKLKWNHLHYPVPDIEAGASDSHHDSMKAVIAGLTTAIATASTNSLSYDDILAIAHQFRDKPRFAYDWMMECVRILKVHVDYSEESQPDQLVRNNPLALTLGILSHMGFHGEFKKRDFCANFGNLALSIRNIIILITLANNTPPSNFKQERISPLDEPEVVEALAGCAKWSLDLLAYLTDCLFNLQDDPHFMSLLTPQEFTKMAPYLLEQNQPALHLLLCSSTRGFLSSLCRRLSNLNTLSNRAVQYYDNKGATDPTEAGRPPSALHIAYRTMQRHTSTSLVKVPEFEKLLGTLAGDVRNVYASSLARMAGVRKQQGDNAAQPPPPEAAVMKRAQMSCELNMLLAHPPPLSFLPVFIKLFGAELRQFRATTDPAALFFYDYRLLEMSTDEKALARRRAERVYVDVFRRVGMKAGAEGEDKDKGGQMKMWRRCARCANVMEDVYGQRPGISFVLQQARRCSCGGSWGLLPKGSLVG